MNKIHQQPLQHDIVAKLERGAHMSVTSLSLDYEQSQRFLQLLKPEGNGFTFQTFDDRKDRRNPALTRIIQSPLPACNELSDLNEQGAGIFVSLCGRGRAEKLHQDKLLPFAHVARPAAGAVAAAEAIPG
jgi:hypothetical protein